MINDIKHELEPLLDYISIIFDEDDTIKYNGIGLKKGITFKNLKDNGVIPYETTKKEFVKLFDWFNDNRETFFYAYEELKGDLYADEDGFSTPFIQKVE